MKLQEQIRIYRKMIYNKSQREEYDWGWRSWKGGSCQMLQRKKTGDWKMPPDLVIRTSLISFNISVALTEPIF